MDTQSPNDKKTDTFPSTRAAIRAPAPAFASKGPVSTRSPAEVTNEILGLLESRDPAQRKLGLERLAGNVRALRLIAMEEHSGYLRDDVLCGAVMCLATVDKAIIRGMKTTQNTQLEDVAALSTHSAARLAAVDELEKRQRLERLKCLVGLTNYADSVQAAKGAIARMLKGEPYLAPDAVQLVNEELIPDFKRNPVFAQMLQETIERQ